MELKYFRYAIEQLKKDKSKLIQQIEDLKKEITNSIEKNDIIKESDFIIQTVAKQTQQKLEFGLSSLPSNALSFVYTIPYTFKVKFLPRRGKTEADLIFEKNGIEFKPGKRTGYGPVDIATLALRLVIYKLKKPKLRNVLLLDEPFPSIDIKVQTLVCQLLQDLAVNNNIQIIMITHNERLMEAADKIYKVEKKNEISIVE